MITLIDIPASNVMPSSSRASQALEPLQWRESWASWATSGDLTTLRHSPHFSA